MTERELARGAARRLAIIRHAQEVTGNVALTCRYYGISATRITSGSGATRSTASRDSATCPRRPLTSPNATTGEVMGKIVYLRKTYHFGPEKISMYLKRYHDVQVTWTPPWLSLQVALVCRTVGSCHVPATSAGLRYARPEWGLAW